MIQHLNEGIYFNLPIEIYHSDPAISKSSVMNLLRSPIDYWVNSPLNPDFFSKTSSKSLDFGKLVDKLLFEQESFKRDFRLTGEGGMGGDNRIVVSKTDYNKALTAINELWGVEYARYILTGGYSQISIFWRDKETGIMLKTRPDYLKTHMATDYKTIKEVSTQDIINQVVAYGYAIQQAIGRVGITTAKQRILAKDKTFIINGADKAQLKWLKKEFAPDPNQDFRFIFQRNSPPNPFEITTLDEDIENKAWQILKKALKIFKDNYTLYGANRWPAGKNKARTITLFEMSRKFSMMAEED